MEGRGGEGRAGKETGGERRGGQETGGQKTGGQDSGREEERTGERGGEGRSLSNNWFMLSVRISSYGCKREV